MTRVLLGLLALAALPSCADQDARLHEQYLDARRKFATAYARTLSDECTVEPECGAATAVFESIPAEHPDHADAAAILERIRVARARRTAVQQDVANSKAAPPPVFPSVEGGGGGR